MQLDQIKHLFTTTWQESYKVPTKETSVKTKLYTNNILFWLCFGLP